jgi:hypothetical protein
LKNKKGPAFLLGFFILIESIENKEQSIKLESPVSLRLKE